MPYIKQEDRQKYFDDCLKIGQKIETVGELNFVITAIAHSYLKKIGVNYTNLSSVTSQLECAKLELYRSLVAPYEDQKIKENGLVGILPEEFKKY